MRLSLPRASASRKSSKHKQVQLQDRGVSLVVLEALTEYFTRRYGADKAKATTEFRVLGFSPKKGKDGTAAGPPATKPSPARAESLFSLKFDETFATAQSEPSESSDSTASASQPKGDKSGSIWWLSEEKHSNLYTAMKNGHGKCKEVLELAYAKGGKGAELFGKPTVFVSHAWEMEWETVVQSLEEFVKANNLDRSKTYFWLDVIAVNQHSGDVIQDKEVRARVFTEFQDELKKMPLVVKEAECLALVVHPFTKPKVFERLWCWNEIVAALESDRKISLALCKESREDLMHVLDQLNEVTEGSATKARELLETLKTLDAMKATCFKKSDKDQILGRLKSLSAIGETTDANWQMKRAIVDALIAESRNSYTGYTSELAPLMENLSPVFLPNNSDEGLADIAAWSKLRIALARQLFAKENRLNEAEQICNEATGRLERLLKTYGLQTKPEHRAESTLDLADAYQAHAESAKGWKREDMVKALELSEKALGATKRARSILDPFDLRELTANSRSPRFSKLEMRTALLEAKITYFMGRTPLLFWEAVYWSRGSGKRVDESKRPEELFDAHAKLQESLSIVHTFEKDLKGGVYKDFLAEDRKELDFFKGDLYGTMAKFIDHANDGRDLKAGDAEFDQMGKFFQSCIALFKMHNDARWLFYTMSQAYVYTGRAEYSKALTLLNEIGKDMLKAALLGQARLGKFLSWGLYVKAAADGLGSTKKANKSDYLRNTLETLASFAEKAKAPGSKITPEEWKCRELQEVHEWFDKLQGDFPQEAKRWQKNAPK